MRAPLRTVPALIAAVVAAGAVGLAEWFDRRVRRAAPPPASWGGDVAVVVLGFPGHSPIHRAVQRWRVGMGVDALGRFPGATLVLTGGPTHGPVSEAAEMAAIATGLGASPDRIVIEDRSRSTWENVTYARALVAPTALVVLVSDGVHIERALGAWRRQFPADAHRVVADPAYRPLDHAWIKVPSAVAQLQRLATRR